MSVLKKYNNIKKKISREILHDFEKILANALLQTTF